MTQEPVQNGKNQTKSLVKMIMIAVLVGLVSSIAISFFLDREAVFGALTMLSWPLIAVPFLLYAAIYFIDTLRLRIVLGQFDFKIRFVDGLVNSILTIFFSNVTPSASGGQPYQIYHLTQVGVESSKATNAVLSRHVEFLLTCNLVLLLGAPIAIQIISKAHLGAGILILGFTTSILFSALFLILLIRPDWIARLAGLFKRSWLGRLVARISKKEDWAERFLEWAQGLRKEVAFLWSEKLPVMLGDTLLGLVNLVLQAASLWFVLYQFTGAQIGLVEMVIAFVAVNYVAYYAPTPGASGGIEGVYGLTFSGLTQKPEATLAAIVVWRIATYYLHLLLGLVLFSCRQRRRARA